MNEKQVNENSALKENQLGDSMGVQKWPRVKERAISGTNESMVIGEKVEEAEKEQRTNDILHGMVLIKINSLVAQSFPILCDPMDCSLPDSPVHGILQARILE